MFRSKILVIPFSFLLCLTVMNQAAKTSAADDNSIVFKTSIQVSTAQVRSIKHADGMWYDDYWHWAPRIKFNVQGPLPGGSQLSTEFFLPGEKSWVKYDCRTPDVAQGQIGKIECGFGLSERELKGIKDTGDFSFKIQMKNELAGTNETLFSGRFNIKKFNAEPDLPVNKNHWLYYVDHDWELPMGMVWYPRPYRSADGVEYYNDYAPLNASFWFKSGQISQNNVAGYLFYQGKEIANTKSAGHVVGEMSNVAGGPDCLYNYARVSFEFMSVLVFAADHRAHPGFYLNENPGEYEVKVLRDGKLTRALKFTVGSDGKLADNGIVANNNILGFRIVVPAQVLGDTDGQWDRNAWKTAMLYGNPMSGFTAP
jgi:hypothetical protein